ncbi:MAG: tRNA (guanosine(37)-N1)-methyltransferase TrmD [Actinomycetales bacterium]|nr:tRNA (guanosine(37)-N1)-methyltransferase TrmD [Actinomycetales bacterium]
MRIDVITIFPEYLAPLDLSLIGRARRAGLLDVRVHDLRDFTHDRHRTVDDTPCGGGPGMVMSPEPWGEALDRVLVGAPEPGASEPGAAEPGAAELGAQEPGAPEPDPSTGTAHGRPTLVLPSPSGEPFRQATARELAGADWLVFGCGRYEGIDERVVVHAAQRMPVRLLSLGDYVLNGGEVAVLAMVEAVARLLPGVLGNAESLVEESHEDGLLEYPVYTRPTSWRGLDVPAVLGSGHHAQIDRWRRDERLRRTARRRPDLLPALDPAGLDPADLAVLAEEGVVVDEAGRLSPGARFLGTSPPVAD